MEMPKRVSIDCNSKNIPTSSRRLLYVPLKPGELRPTRRYMERHFGRFFSSTILLITFEVLVCYFAQILHEKCARKHIFTPIKSSVNTSKLVVMGSTLFMILFFDKNSNTKCYYSHPNNHIQNIRDVFRDKTSKYGPKNGN